MNADDMLKDNQYRHPHTGRYTTGSLGVPQIQGGPAPAKSDPNKPAARSATELLNQIAPAQPGGDEHGRGGGTAA